MADGRMAARREIVLAQIRLTSTSTGPSCWRQETGRPCPAQNQEFRTTQLGIWQDGS
jgi:hypothetical protein